MTTDLEPVRATCKKKKKTKLFNKLAPNYYDVIALQLCREAK